MQIGMRLRKASFFRLNRKLFRCNDNNDQQNLCAGRLLGMIISTTLAESTTLRGFQLKIVYANSNT